MSRRLALAALLVLTACSPAAAYLVEVTTSVAVSDAHDQGAVRNAVLAAVDEILKEAIGFKPTLVVLTSASVVRDRLYIRLLVADEAGERTYNELRDDDGSETGRTDLRI
jgi:hypothetical protein